MNSSFSSFSESQSSYTKPLISTGSPSPRSVTSMIFFDSFSDDEVHHFLDSCFLCHKNLKSNTDIFMYKGDTPFCSEDCRQKQIDLDESNDQKKKKKKKMKQ
ncbi:Zf-FLZ domain-containing protein [Dioscorea alata]|uniref:Zf-FLZ domain-containing protein n=1 Tax=Dioscorea alata TaxID=55571 RepID=A0ACB7WIF3_DIOAL|nr:Zf-FLZ domain-containing protein [Dioscorea alata]